MRRLCLLPRGTTSAYAENTRAEVSRNVLSRNYLRVRGEYRPHGGLNVSMAELPPRTRRIHPDPQDFDQDNRTTSAYAENTHQ